MSVDLSEFVGEFLQESYEGLDLMESCLLNFEEEREGLDRIFRVAHSIKGGADTFGFSKITEFTHIIETVLDEIRSENLVVTGEILNALLASVDVLRLLLKVAQSKQALTQSLVDDPKKRLQKILDEHRLKPIQTAVMIDVQQLSVSGESNSDVVDHWLIVFQPDQNMLQGGHEPIYIFEALAKLGELIIEPITDFLPLVEVFYPQKIYLHWDLKLKTTQKNAVKARAEIEEVFEWVADFCDLTVTAITLSESNQMLQRASDQPKKLKLPEVLEVVLEQAPSGPESTADSSVTDELVIDRRKVKRQSAVTEVSSMRVDTGKFDELTSAVDKLMTTQGILIQVADDLLKSGYSNPQLAQGLVKLERNISEIEEHILRIRMQPMSFVFDRFQRLVHDISLSLGKKVSLDIIGSKTEIDRRVMEKIVNPITHLIRNALDHGLETPRERLAMNKPETGHIKLAACHQNGFIVIDIIDDGRGLDKASIRAKALQKGLITAQQCLATDDIYSLVFKPGLSTVNHLSELSGRGVGLDIVLKNIESLGGQVKLTSEEGRGTVFSVRVPIIIVSLAD